MSSSASSCQVSQKKKSLWTHLIAGGGAGLVESCTCHPLDTIKVRMQLSGEALRSANLRKLGPFGTFVTIVKTEGPLALYKGLGPVVCAIVPKMAIRFTSFEAFKDLLGTPSTQKTFIAGLGAGIVESVVVMNPMEVIKIRLQAQKDAQLKYLSTRHAAVTILREEGIGAFYRGVFQLSNCQATNQAVNFTLYQEFKKVLQTFQGITDLPSWQHLVAGGISGAIAPCANAPIDIVKTRIQKQIDTSRSSGFSAIKSTVKSVYKSEGLLGFYRGLTPRLLRIAPGQAITFMVYERIHKFMNDHLPQNSESVMMMATTTLEAESKK